jgi:hypothetical protein
MTYVTAICSDVNEESKNEGVIPTPSFLAFTGFIDSLVI